MLGLGIHLHILHILVLYVMLELVASSRIQLGVKYWFRRMVI